MKIIKVDENIIEFDNGEKIEIQTDVEDSYADCKQIEQLAFDYDFKEINFEFVTNFGFRFGDDNCMFGIPFYDESDCYYSTEFTIIYKNKKLKENHLFT